MMIQVILCISCIECGIDHVIVDNSFTFVFDRSIYEIVKENALNRTRVYLRNDNIRNNETDAFIWDKNLPKPMFFRVEFRNLTKSTLKTPLELKCLSGRKEELCRFKIEYNLKKFIVYDICKISEKVEMFNEDLINDLILSSDKNNTMALKNSLDYLNSVELMRNLHLILLERFYDYIESIYLLKEQVAIYCTEKAILKNLWNVEKHAIEISNIIAKSLASLRIPSLIKMEYVESNNYFLQYMANLSKMTYELLYTLETHFQNVDTPTPEGNHVVAASYNRFYKTARHLLIIPDKRNRYSYENIYKHILKHLQSVDDKNKEIVDYKNTQIIFDCEMIKIDKFIEKYSSLLIEYCNMMVVCDEIHLTAYYLSKYFIDSESYLNVLEETYADILIARKMAEYLRNYEHDKIDFFIFSQTEYFKNKLSFNILTNLEVFIFSIEFKIKHFDDVQDKDEELLKKENEVITKLKDLKKRWESIINPYNDGSIQSFFSLLSNILNLPQNETIKRKSRVKENKTNNVFYQTIEEDIKKNTDDTKDPEKGITHTFNHKIIGQNKPLNSGKNMKSSGVMSNNDNIKLNISSVDIYSIIIAFLWLIISIICYKFIK